MRDDVSATGLKLSIVKPNEDAAHNYLNKIWRVAPRLSFSNELFARAHHDGAVSAFAYSSEVMNSVSSTIKRFDYCKSMVPEGRSLHGVGRHINEIFANESRAWVVLNKAIHETFLRYVDVIGYEIDRSYASGAICAEEPSETQCYYCARAVSIIHVAPPYYSCERLISRCDGCGVISDTDIESRSVRLCGPDRAKAGSTIRLKPFLAVVG